ncbi:MAG: tRNA (uridine(54)-C5)-methyltransferase TrmA [Campylobacterota bacterium]|nr:tRNA (uridine(54)-C5)-methyltransferase TrmA [Campylobacterota bacterium]
MTCEYFGICGSCNLGGNTYKGQLDIKLDIEKNRFLDIYDGEYNVIESKDGAFRNRVEFRLWKEFGDNDKVTIHYAMNNKEKKPFTIKSCSIVSDHIAQIMPKLITILNDDEVFSLKVFAVEFLGSTTDDMLVTLIYHRKLDENWTKKAKEIEKSLGINLIGRSRKQKVVVSKEYIEDTLTINNNKYNFHYKEGGFTQPNQKVNEKMIEWAINNSKHNGDLCELYCGGGNFTIPFSKSFNKVLATEISKTSINSAKENCTFNNIENIKFIRMSSEEFVEARNGVREFRRMKQEDVMLDDYNFSTIFVDPPRAGLDDTTRELCGDFDQIIYISCNPETLHRDLKELISTHKIEKFAFFDQFAYSSHIESGVILYKS